MSASATVQNASNLVTVRLNAVELADFKLECGFDCEPAIETSYGEKYAEGLIRYLCHDGIRVARSKLRLPNGLSVRVTEIQGILQNESQIGVCHATSLAIARALGKDESPILNMLEDWEMVE